MAEGRSQHRLRPRVLLLSDSRGRGLEKLLNDNKWNIAFRVETYPGATVKRINEKLSVLRNRGGVKDYDLIIIFAGICNVTKIVYQPDRVAVLRFDTAEEIENEFKKECSQ